MALTSLKSTVIFCGVLILAQATLTAPHRIPVQISGSDEIIYSENFESGTGGWSGYDLTNAGVIWHEDSYNAVSGDSCWWCGNPALMGYNDNWLQYLVSPEIDLSGAANPVLTCILYWSVEDSGSWGEYDGRDGCNLWIFNSDTLVNDWEVLLPDYPGYTCQSLRSFGWRWEMGSGIPGWAGFSGGWISASFDLSAYTQPGVRLRFAFASDEANSTMNMPSLLGFFVDNIEVREGAIIYLRNNAEGNSYPGQFTFETGTPSGDHWAFTQDNYHSFSHSWNCNDLYFLSNALISPSISIPLNMSTRMKYWVYCDMPDYDGNGDNHLDDYYYIDVVPVGNIFWTPLVYDWAHNGSQVDWVERTFGYYGEEALPTTNINLTPWAGQNVRIRFRTITDGDDDGGSGTGLFIDDIQLTAEALPENDAGATRLIVPFPTYEGQGPISCSVDLVNYGTQNQSQVPAFWSVNGTSNALFPWSQISAQDTVTRAFQWTSPGAGLYNFKAYTQLSSDEDNSNDTSKAGDIEVTPPGIFELGYDHRQVTYLGYYPFSYDTHEGPLVHFTPADDGIPGDLNGNIFKAMFVTTGSFDLHVFSDGVAVNPGTEVYSRTVTIDAGSLAPNWAEIDISDCSYLQGGHPNFWVWLEVTSTNSTPHITGSLQDCFTPGHFFIYNGVNTVPSLLNFNVRAIFSGTVAAEPQEQQTGPYSFELLQNYPNPFNPTTSILFSLDKPGFVRLTVIDLMGRIVDVLADRVYSAGSHAIHFDASTHPSGIYVYRLEENGKIMQKKMLLLK